MASQLQKNALAVIDAYNAWDIEKIIGVRAPSCIHEILPKSLGREPRSNAQYRSYFSAIMPYFENFTVTVQDLVEDTAARKVAIWASSTATSPIGPYANEYMLVLHFDEAGEKLVRFLEFVDAKRSGLFFPRLQEYIEEKKVAGGV